MMEHVLIIGASGMLGQALTRVLTEEGLSPELCSRTRISSTSLVQHDVRDLHMLPKSFDTVFLAAAHIPYGAMEAWSEELIEANIRLPLEVCRLFPESRILLSSSTSVYGLPLVLPITVDHPFNQPNAYGLSKLASESVVIAHGRYAIFRFSSLYGRGMRAPTFLPTIVRDALQSKTIRIHGNGQRRQDYLHYDDAAAMLCLAGRSDASFICNGAAGVSVSNNEVASMVGELVGDVSVNHCGSDASPSFEYSLDPWHRHFDYKPKVELREGLQEMVSDVRQGIS